MRRRQFRRAVGDGLDPVLRRQLDHRRASFGSASCLLDRFGNPHAEVHRVAGRLAVGVDEGERPRRLAVPQDDRLAILDLLQRPGGSAAIATSRTPAPPSPASPRV